MSWHHSIDATPGQPVTELPRATLTDPEDVVWQEITTGFGPSSSGVRVTPEKVIGHAPAWQALQIIGGDIGRLPLRVERRQATGSSANPFAWYHDPTHPIDRLLAAPFEGVTQDVFRQTLQTWSLVWGNGFARIERDRGNGQIRGLRPLPPARLSKLQDPLSPGGEGWLLRYTPQIGRAEVLRPDELLHIRGLALDGSWGRSAVDLARNDFGFGLAAHGHAAATMRNGGKPSGVLEHSDGNLSPDARQTLRREWRAMHSGPENASQIAILYNGMSYKAISPTNHDAQLLELLRFDREQIASMFNLPAAMLNALENSATRANVAEMLRGYAARTLATHATRWGHECTAKLLTEEEIASGDVRVVLSTEELTAGSIDERASRATKLVRGRLATKNEGRVMVGLPPVEGGDVFENPAIDPAGAGSDEDGDQGGDTDRDGLPREPGDNEPTDEG